MITKEMLQKGLEANIVCLVPCPHDDTTVVCQIGEYWFYFAGRDAENISVDDFKAYMTEEEIIDEIALTLAEFHSCEATADEYAYYESILRCFQKFHQEISLTVDSNQDGTYDISICDNLTESVNASSITAQEAGEYVSLTIDSAEIKTTGKSHLLPKEKYVLSSSDGFSINSIPYDTFEEANQAMCDAYDSFSADEFDDNYTDMSVCRHNDAIIYGKNTVYVWNITKVTF